MLPDNGKPVKQRNNLHMKGEELRIILDYVKKNCGLKWYAFLLILTFRGMRPQEALAINVLDFNKDFTRLGWRECKTNKMRRNEVIIKPVADLLKTYAVLNRFRLREGFLFPVYTNTKSHPYMSSKTASTWFSHKVRDPLKKKHPSFKEHYLVQTAKGKPQRRYRISLYSFRRFFETYIYVNNNFNIALIKEIMDYSSKFDPMKHYIKVTHGQEEKSRVIEQTFNTLAKELGVSEW